MSLDDFKSWLNEQRQASNEELSEYKKVYFATNNEVTFLHVADKLKALKSKLQLIDKIIEMANKVK